MSWHDHTGSFGPWPQHLWHWQRGMALQSGKSWQHVWLYCQLNYCIVRCIFAPTQCADARGTKVSSNARTSLRLTSRCLDITNGLLNIFKCDSNVSRHPINSSHCCVAVWARPLQLFLWSLFGRHKMCCHKLTYRHPRYDVFSGWHSPSKSKALMSNGFAECGHQHMNITFTPLYPVCIGVNVCPNSLTVLHGTCIIDVFGARHETHYKSKPLRMVCFFYMQTSLSFFTSILRDSKFVYFCWFNLIIHHNCKLHTIVFHAHLPSDRSTLIATYKLLTSHNQVCSSQHITLYIHVIWVPVSSIRHTQPTLHDLGFISRSWRRQCSLTSTKCHSK